MVSIESVKENPFELPVKIIFLPRGKESQMGVSIEGEGDGFTVKDGKIVYAVRVDGNSSEDIRRFAHRCIRIAREYKLDSIYVVPPSDDKDAFFFLSEGIVLSSYTFDKYLSQKPFSIKKVYVYSQDPNGVLSAIREGIHFAEATNFARDLVNEPPNAIYPETLRDVAIEISRQSSQFDIEVLDREKMERLGMNAILSVARGSAREPYFVHLSYKPEKTRRRVALVGKAVTFDSGGLNIKTYEGMKTMKMDMAGSAAVLGVAKALAFFKPDIEVHVFFAAVENMPDGGAYKPGDVVRAYNGKTIEILNTDAEGRLTLADVLSFVSRHHKNVDYVIDLATLTGAIMVALGPYRAGLFTQNEQLREGILRSGEIEGEAFWPMPFDERLGEKMKSRVADLKNTAEIRWGGAISAAMFLREFVDFPEKWAHIDIAGPAFTGEEVDYNPPGGTGFGVRTLLRWLLSF